MRRERRVWRKFVSGGEDDEEVEEGDEVGFVNAGRRCECRRCSVK